MAAVVSWSATTTRMSGRSAAVTRWALASFGTVGGRRRLGLTRSPTSSDGVFEIRWRVYSCCGLASISAVSPYSTMLPSASTATFCAIDRTSGRLCVTKTIDRPSSRCRLAEQLDDRRLHADVERRGDLVADQDRRLGDQRAGDRDPLPLATRALVGVAPGVARRQRHLLEHLADPRLGRPCPTRCRRRSSGCPTVSPMVLRGFSEP